MKKAIIILILLYMVQVSYASIESLGVFQKDSEIELIQTCANCTFVNITTITAPNSTIILTDTTMIKNGLRYNYTLPGQSNIGTYSVCGVGDLDKVYTVWCFDFKVTQDGYVAEPNIGLYIALIILAISFMGIGIFLFYKKKEEDE
jgi:hypothetical protein